MECKHCKSTRLVKFGMMLGKQRYKCKDCKKSTRLDDKRIKYPPEKKLRVIRMYMENVGIRAIERLEGVPNSLIIKWIRSSAKFISGLLRQSALPEEPEKVEIIEMEELYSFVKKNKAESSYGLLRIGTKEGLLIMAIFLNYIT